MKHKIVIKTPLIIVIILAFLVPITLAIYKHSVNSYGSLVLASWDVSLNQTNVNDHLQIMPNNMNASYTLNVRSESQVDMVYSIVIDNLPSGVSVSLDNGEFTQQDNNNKIVFNNVGTILYSSNTKERSHTLTFTAANNATFVSNQEVNVNVIAKQLL